MPLLKRSQVPLAQFPSETELANAKHVLQIRFTGEMFLSYAYVFCAKIAKHACLLVPKPASVINANEQKKIL